MARDAEIQQLKEANQRILESPRSCEVVLVHGESGSGKTALIQHCFQSQHDGGTMISGKFDVIHSQKPYSAFVDALTQLCRSPAWNREAFSIASSKGFTRSDLKMLAKVVPAVERLEIPFLQGDTDEIDAESSSEPTSSDNTFAFARFTEVVRSFLFAVAGSLSSPLVLFLDDVQAADKESMSLISSVTSAHTESCNMLLILSYRDPVDTDQELQLRDLISSSTGFRITNIQVGRLDEDKVNKLISKLLRMNESETAPLSRLVAQRTGGNVYFSLQFLEMFKKERLVQYSFAICSWEWDLERIRAETNVTENVALLFTTKIKQLPSGVQLVLQLAACFGFYFDVAFLERMLTQASSATDGRVLLSSDEFTRSVAIALDESLIDTTGNGTRCKFTHDRVLQAAYEMIPAGRDRETLHWRIGQALWTELQQATLQEQDPSQASRDWLLFSAADQLNRGACRGATTKDVVSSLDLARLNMDAGKAALEKSAFKYATDFLSKGVEMVKDLWQSEYSLCLELFTLSAETEYAASNFIACDQRVNQILLHGQCLEDKLPAYLVKVQSLGVRGNILKALDESVAVLRMLGERISRRPNLLTMLLELDKTRRLLRKRKLADFVSLPDMTDAMKIWATKFLLNVTMYSWYAGQNESVVVSACRMVRLTGEYGVSSHGPFVLATYGVTLGFLGDLSGAHEVGRVTLELSKRPHTKICHARAAATVYSFLNSKEPAVRNLDHFMDGYNIGLKSGEIDGAAMCLSMYGILGMFLGKNLHVVLSEMNGFRQAFREDIESNFTMTCLLPWHQFGLNMVGQSDNPLVLTGDIVNEESYMSEVRRTGNEIAKATMTITRMMLLYILCEIEDGAKEVGNLDMEIVSKGTHISTPFLLTFAALAMLASARKTRKRKELRRARMIVRIIERFAKAGNLNTPPLLKLMAAEQTSLHRRSSPDVVKKEYEAAIRMASQSGLSVFEAIGNERAGEYMHAIGDTFWAETYLSRAFRLYDEWGAATKTKQMMDKYSFVFQSDHPSSGSHKSVGVSMRKRYSYKPSNERHPLNVA